METYKAIFLDRKLLNGEYEQLMQKGYLRLKVALHFDALQLFQKHYRVGDEIVFQTTDGSTLTTRITNIDVAEPQDDEFKVFIGFAAI